MVPVPILAGTAAKPWSTKMGLSPLTLETGPENAVSFYRTSAVEYLLPWEMESVQ
jgi:hypothetical protein